MENIRSAEAVFKYFEKLCTIPHGSGNTKMISDYLASFASEFGYEYIQDELNNLIILKKYLYCYLMTSELKTEVRGQEMKFLDQFFNIEWKNTYQHSLLQI